MGMSGQTFTTIIRIPTALELAERAARESRDQGTASAGGFAGSQSLAGLNEIRNQAVRCLLAASAPLAVPVPGTITQAGDGGARLEVAIRGARAEVEVAVEPNSGKIARVALSFAHAHGLTCAEEAQAMADVAQLWAAAGLDPHGGGPLSGAAAQAQPAARKGNAP
jgi:hypothetical protein